MLNLGGAYNQAWVLTKEISISVIIMLALCFTLRGGIFPFLTLNQSYVTHTAPSDSCCDQTFLPLTTKVVRLESMHATCFNKTLRANGTSLSKLSLYLRRTEN